MEIENCKQRIETNMRDKNMWRGEMRMKRRRNSWRKKSGKEED